MVTFVFFLLFCICLGSKIQGKCDFMDIGPFFLTSLTKPKESSMKGGGSNSGYSFLKFL